MKIDLHCHSTHSDGSKSVEEILEAAENLGIVALCISDHDNPNGSIHAKRIAPQYFSGILIAGIEISTKIKGRTVHLLAYFPDIDGVKDSKLAEALAEILDSRVGRMKRMVKNAQQHGFDISFDDVLREAGMGKENQPTDVISRPHMARAMIRKGYVASIDEAFDKYLGEGKPLHAARISLSFEDWISLVHELQGLVSWAHPLFNHENSLEMVKQTASILVERIDGIEIFYRYDGKYPVSKELQENGFTYLMHLTAENNLLRTAGGDYHGDVGFLGGVDLPENDWLRFKSRLFANK